MKQIKKAKIVDVAATVLLFIGFFFAFLPHALHNAVLKDEGASHLNHVIFGMALVVISLGILIWNKKKK